ncbi:cyclase family protein [Adhaeribacter soli]|uniref:Cyclase family protein n=1 Tax=Adhaeribacter soli TaxID=2607655 RepID=A0A5N1J077_9BACT|nr:cyclase family protein [Adhaeribacter soli]KAA9340105.1 cyclase family protein [Adhaeribacter soli]
MQATITHAGKQYRFSPENPLDISLPLKPGADTVNCFWAEPVQFDTIRIGSFVGSVAEGGCTNYQRVHVTPHGNGTHTECYGHISPDPEATIYNCLKQFLFVAQVISVVPKKQENGDLVVMLEDVKPKFSAEQPEAIIIRTLENAESKKTAQYSGTNPTYLEAALAEFLVQSEVKHLLVDLPSVDREEDGGELLAHHAFWQYPENTRKNATITELIFVPDEIKDGLYLLNIQITSLTLDASPSKPVLYVLDEIQPQ